MAPEESHSRNLRRAGNACLAGAAILAIVATILDARLSWPLWLMLTAGGLQVISNVVRPGRPRLGDALAVAGALFSVATVITLFAVHR